MHPGAAYGTAQAIACAPMKPSSEAPLNKVGKTLLAAGERIRHIRRRIEDCNTRLDQAFSGPKPCPPTACEKASPPTTIFGMLDDIENELVYATNELDRLGAQIG